MLPDIIRTLILYGPLLIAGAAWANPERQECLGLKAVFERYPEKTVIQTKGADEQAKFLSENVPGLPEAQAKVILDESHSRDSSAVFGGSRVRGNHTGSSDLDVGFGGLNANQAASC